MRISSSSFEKRLLDKLRFVLSKVLLPSLVQKKVMRITTVVHKTISNLISTMEESGTPTH